MQSLENIAALHSVNAEAMRNRDLAWSLQGHGYGCTPIACRAHKPPAARFADAMVSRADVAKDHVLHVRESADGRG